MALSRRRVGVRIGIGITELVVGLNIDLPALLQCAEVVVGTGAE